MNAPTEPTDMAGPDALLVVERPGGVVVLVMSGELDHLTVPSVRETLLAVLVNRPALVVIDLLNVDFLDSAGLGVLIEAAQACGSDVGLRVVANRSVTLRPIQFTGLQGFLQLHPTVDDALASFGS